ncbi:putative transcription factor bHLH family [Lupinus albus]|uniref:Putative transcription factor bHLH family n=1 Tax=Lupinus albus TaxID=3870 RepID=A0A6A4R2F7_LUPAL|nr:putative transcription factor bHLH family [Lupinus albus]
MFPLQRGKEVVIKFSNSPHQQQNQITEDLILDDYDSLVGVNDSDKIITTNQTKKLIYGSEKSSTHDDSNEHMKKIVHRDIERQRRQEMATLHASLRSLLPLEFIKGKRSISDHMNEAVNYIKYMQENIKELGAKRDELKKLSTSKLLVEERLEVVNCLSTEVNGRLLHSVQCEVNKSNSVDMSELRRKVGVVFPSYKCCE